MADKKRNVCKRADSSILKLKRMYMCEFVSKANTIDTVDSFGLQVSFFFATRHAY